MARTRDPAAYEQKRQAILRAAETLFLEQGFHQTGMASICKAANMSPGALYRYFDSKTAIITAFVEEETAETSAWLAGLSDATDFKAALKEGLSHAMHEVSDPDYGQLALDIAAEAGRQPDVAAAIEKADLLAMRELKRLIKQHAPQIKLKPETVARILMSLVDGATGLDASLPKKAQLTAAIDVMVDGLFE